VKKEEGDALSVSSTKKTWISTKEQLEYRTLDNPEEFLGLRAAERASFNEVQPGTLDYVPAWSKQEAKREEAERARHLGFVMNLKDDDDAAVPSQRRGDDRQGCSS
jgi:hypothetical protein